MLRPQTLAVGSDLRGENSIGCRQSRLRELLATITRPTVIMGPGIASSLPAGAPLSALPTITNPQAALDALAEFFESRQMLMREDFLRILRKSQNSETKP